MTLYDISSVRILDIQDIDAVVELQGNLLASLPLDQDVLHFKTRDEYADILNDPDKCVIGIDADDGLGAMSVIIEPTKDNPDADIMDFPLPDELERLSTISSVMVRPDQQGGNMMSVMLDFWHDRAKRLDRNNLLSLVTRTNTPSWHSFLKAGLQVTNAGIDPIDGASVYLLHRDLNSAKCQPCESCTSKFNLEARALPISSTFSLNTLRGLLCFGFRGAHAERSANDNRPTGRLLLYHKSVLECNCSNQMSCRIK